jgi:hypothetical protein
VATGSARKATDFPCHGDRVEARLQRIGNGATQGAHGPDARLRGLRCSIKHSASFAHLHLEAFHSYSSNGNARWRQADPWTALRVGLSALISLGFFLLQLSSKCQDAVLAWFAGRVTWTFAQSYPQKLWGKRHGD